MSSYNSDSFYRKTESIVEMSIHSCSWNSSSSSLEYKYDTYVLVVTGSVGVLVSLRGEEIHVRDLVEEGLIKLASGSSLGSRGEGLSGGDEGNRNDGGGLHDGTC